MTFNDPDNWAPPDVVPGEGPTLEDLARWNAAVGGFTHAAAPTTLIESPAGEPMGVLQEAGPEWGYLGRVAVSRRDLARLGLTEQDFHDRFPRLRLLPTPTKEAP